MRRSSLPTTCLQCLWKHWKTPQKREKNLVKLGIDRDTARRVAYTGNRIAYVCNKGAVNVAISNKRLASFGLVSMLDYYTERCVSKNCAKLALISRSIFRLNIAVTSPFDIVDRQRFIIGLDRLNLAVPHVNDAVRTLGNIRIVRDKNDRIPVFR